MDFAIVTELNSSWCVHTYVRTQTQVRDGMGVGKYVCI